MKTYFLPCLLAISSLAMGQEFSKSFSFEGVDREYIEYVPNLYDGSTAVPLLLSLHGLGDNMNNFKQVGFHGIADTANFIVLTPQALVDPLMNASAWNSGAGFGGFFLNQDVNDVGFIKALIDTVVSQYNIDEARIFVTGFSMGGFMSNRLACELNYRIAAFASVAGTIGNGIQCSPGREVPAMHLHGTEDGTVGYSNNSFGNNAEDWWTFWQANNSASGFIDSLEFPNGLEEDSIKVYSYRQEGAAGSEVFFIKAEGAGHQWLFTPQNDVDYHQLIWNFFLEQSHPQPSGLGLENLHSIDFKMYPNPFQNRFQVGLSSAGILRVFNAQGQLILSKYFPAGTHSINTSGWSAGQYFIQAEGSVVVGVKE